LTPEPSGWTPSRPSKPALHEAAEQIGKVEALDQPAKKLGKVVRSALGPGKLKDALSGTFLGHALHPLLTDIPIGTWTSAIVLDLTGGRSTADASRRLIGTGILAALPTAASGYSDWADSEVGDDSVRRIGIVHAAANVTALTLFTASWAARRRGSHGGGVAIALAGAGALAVGGHLGGHLSYVNGIGVDQTTFDEGPGDWTATVAEDELAEGSMTCADVAGRQVLLARTNGTVYALANRCTHRGGPLHEGELEDGCVVCPWHDSRFRLDDGAVDRGPATAPQPSFETRVRDGRIEVRLAVDPTP
jgi:nitrite reductase/ring-hydroxylating ferredoxin subunit/uncharacterized membrane protein